MRFTREHFNQGLSSNGGYSHKQLKLLNVNTKKAGWKDRVMRKDYKPEVIEKFIALKDAHLVDGQNVFQRGAMKLPERWKRKEPSPDEIGERDRVQRFEYAISKPERDGQIEWFTDLRTAIVEGKTDDALAAVESAIKLLVKGNENDGST